jgi:NADH-quinone oxidoreductase subunit D
MFLGACPVEPVPPLSTFRERETVLAVMEELSGGRMHYMFNRVGGLREDLPAGWLSRVADVVGAVTTALPRIEEAVFGRRGFDPATRGIGVLDPALVDAYGVSGPLARASGADFDLRRDEPYLAYGDLLRDGVLDVPVRHEGDCAARFRLLLDQVTVSLALAAACVERLRSLPAGPVNGRQPKILGHPEGSTYAWSENPLGINGYYLVSRAERTPWRMKLRTASFNNVAVLPAVLEGCRVADLVVVLGSLFFVVGDIDK